MEQRSLLINIDCYFNNYTSEQRVSHMTILANFFRLGKTL